MATNDRAHSTEVISTKDGPMNMDVLRPTSGTGPWPAVLFCVDGVGPRATMVEMARRIADGGYVVVVPDVFHRAGSVLDVLPAGTPREHKSFWGIFGNAEARAAWKSRFYDSATNHDNLRTDFGAVFAWLDAQPDVRKGAVGATGYCMGGNIALRLAALFPDRVKAAGVFHGGNLATDAPDSPHLGAPKIRGEVYVGGAIEDPSFSDAMKNKLDEALTAAGVAHTIETYPARHGYAVHDAPTYNEAAAERHYAALADLLARALPRA